MAGQRVIVVGAGVGGLVAAALAARDGFDVTVVEAAATPGGKLRALPVGSAQIDAGPTVFTMRSVFDAVFEACGERLDDHVSLTPAHTLARHAWRDGSTLDLFADPEASTDAIGRFAGADAARGYTSFRREAARIYNIVDRPFLHSAKTGPVGLCRSIGLGHIGDLLAIRPYESMWKVIGEHFADARLRQLFGRYATYCGSDPFRTPATLMLIAHVEASGVWLVAGGMHHLAHELAGLAERAGVKFRYGARVDEILCARGRCAGVTLTGGERIDADSVILNADPAALATGRFGKRASASAAAIAPKHRSMSALVTIATAKATGHELKRHNVLFSDDYHAEFAALRSGRVPPDPSVYLCAQDRQEGPTGLSSERFQVIVNAPANGDTHHYTEQEIEICKTQMLTSLARCGVHLTVDALSVQTPNDFETLNRSTGGALYGRASHGWAASFRRQGTRTRMPGLYCAGGSTHPGAGIPMAALSGRLAVECLHSDRASTARFRRGGTAGGMSTRSAMTDATA